MPLKVYIAPGTSLDSLINPEFGVPYTSVENRDHWPDLVAGVVQNPAQLNSLQPAQGYVQEHFQAARQGIQSWAGVSGGKYSFEFTDDPSDADIYVFWTNHFVNKLGLALFENDIRGYTAKRSFPYQAVMAAIAAGKQITFFKPVVTLLRTVDGAGNPMPIGKMQASAAHEFGHALGIEDHSQNPGDLMSVYYGHGVISANDAATIRALYSMQPDYIP
jgi:predicted Zn-dependent protease